VPSLRELQQLFSDSVFSESETGFADHVVEDGIPAARRIQVYRNNMRASLTDALGAVFPVIQRLVGDDFFGYAARSYIHSHPSRSGNLHDFGAQFPGFLESFPPAGELPYLGDVARVEWSYHAVFHAAAHPPLDLQALAAVPPHRHGAIRFRLTPACRLLASRFPVLRIWAVNQNEYVGDQTVNLGAGEDNVLIIRRGLDIEFQPLDGAEYAFLDALGEGINLAESHERALEIDTRFDLPATMHRHVTGQTIVGFSAGENG
jgi:hypothetical protein